MTEIRNKASRQFRISRTRDQVFRKVSHFLIGEVLGKGGFGSVFEAIDIHTKERLAVKIINIKGESKEFVNKIKEEVDILQIIDHSNVVRIYETFQDDLNYLIFTEIIEGVELFQYICHHGPLKQLIAAQIFHQLVCTIKYLHKKGIIHRDIKAQNIMIDQELRVKLIDFGLSTYKNSKREASQITQWGGSPSYIAPQLLEKKKFDGRKVDVWCLGVVLYAMLEGSLPFDMKDYSIQKRNENIRLMKWHRPLYSSTEAKQLYALIFTDSEQRVGIHQILKSAFFKKYNLTSEYASCNNSNNQFDTIRQEKAIQLTSQILNIDEQLVKLHAKERQLGEVYTVYNLLLKKDKNQNISKKQIRIKTEAKISIKENSSQEEAPLTHPKILKTDTKTIKQDKKSPIKRLTKDLTDQKFQNLKKTIELRRSQDQIQLPKLGERYIKLQQIAQQKNKTKEIKSPSIGKSVKNSKYSEVSKSEIFQLKKIQRKNYQGVEKKDNLGSKSNSNFVYRFRKIIRE